MESPRPALLLLLFLLVSCREPQRLPNASFSIVKALGTADTQGFKRAIARRDFHFPADHGPHRGFRTEWWYYTGNLSTSEGRRFGFQLTFFRSALTPTEIERESAWATRTAWMAHFTVSDVEGGAFHSFERWGREALGMAGATGSPFHVWVKDWSAEGVNGQAPPMRLRATQDDIAVDLILLRGKPPVLQGDRGLSSKSAEPGNASYYYSLTRMPARGTLRIEDRSFDVTGLAWMDREWSTSALGPDQVGWDWFAMQLSDGRDIMLYQLRRKDGSADPSSSGTVIDRSGESRRLEQSDIRLQATAFWTSPRSGARYPAGWRLRIPGEELDLFVEPVLADQELDVSFHYWEGTVRVAGSAHGQPVEGRGYVEMTGYTESGR